jgi:dihydroflavonol-4-reductase
MKVWLGGATGFLGQHVAVSLATREAEIVAVSRGGGSLEIDIGEVRRTVEVSRVDVLDAAAVAESARGATHAILCTGRVSRDPSDAELLHQLHVEGTKQALKGLRAAGVKRVVVTSTSGTIAVSADADRIDDETSGSPLELIASWPYYRSKYYGERAALEQSGPDFEVIVVNPSLLLGPGDLRESSTLDVRRFIEGAFAATPRGGLALVDVRDAAEGTVLALLKGRAGERYILNAANLSFSAFFGRLARITGVRAPRLSAPANRQLALGLFSLYDGAIRRLGGRAPIERLEVELSSYFWYASAAKAERELGFVARDPGETLRDTVQDLIARQVVAPLAG